jgi:hypothetical protein
MDFDPINAMPTKKLFIDTLIRDVSLKDAVLDLVDNAIDGYIRRNFDDTREIKIGIQNNKFEIEDNCGGIEINHVVNEVFRFGVTDVCDKRTLGVYGIGLKRSMFKIGKLITFESDDLSKYFRIKINLREWEISPTWTHEFDEVTKSTGRPFTRISIQEINEDISTEFIKETFKNELIQRISKTYYLFLKDKINIYLNDNYIEPIELKIGFSSNIEPAVNSFSINGVAIKLTAGAHPDYKDPGWYIFCNDRLVIVGDRTNLTGWGNRGVPSYHPKFNRFKGFAYIKSSDPSKLPWNTAKNNLDTSSNVYKIMIEEMQTMTQQFTSYMSMETISVSTLDRKQDFKAPSIPITPAFATIRYKKPKKQVDQLKECLGSRWLSNKEVGERTFEYYREMECSDDD